MTQAAYAKDPTPGECRLAQDVSRNFVFALTKGNMDEALKFMGKRNSLKDKDSFTEHTKKQLGEFYGINLFKAFATADGSNVYCLTDGKTHYFHDNRVLTHPFGFPNNQVKILNLSIRLDWENQKWKVSHFSSTAMWLTEF